MKLVLDFDNYLSNSGLNLDFFFFSIKFEVVDTLDSSQVLFSYQDFPPSQTVLSLQGLGILRRARGRNQYKYVAARQIIRLLWILDINYGS